MKTTSLAVLSEVFIHYPFHAMAFLVACCLAGALLLRSLGNVDQTRLFSKGLELLFASMLVVAVIVAGALDLHRTARPAMESRTDAMRSLR